MGVSVWCFVLLCVRPSFAIISLGKRELVSLLFVVFWMSCRCYRFLTLSQGAMDWSVVCDCGISWSNSLTFWANENMLFAQTIDSKISWSSSFCFRCDEVCPTACFDKTCYPDLTCKVCEVNHWGPKCEYTCNDHCQDATSTSISACDRDGKCLFGCEKTFWGNTCSTNCPDNCLGKDCNASTGQCVQGCIKSYWGDVCENDCSMKCLETDCYRFNATCRLGCVNGDYGMNCSMKCSENCLNGTCFRENGTCSLGCDGDYIGEQCNERKYTL